MTGSGHAPDFAIVESLHEIHRRTVPVIYEMRPLSEYGHDVRQEDGDALPERIAAYMMSAHVIDNCCDAAHRPYT